MRLCRKLLKLSSSTSRSDILSSFFSVHIFGRIYPAKESVRGVVTNLVFLNRPEIQAVNQR